MPICSAVAAPVPTITGMAVRTVSTAMARPTADTGRADMKDLCTARSLSSQLATKDIFGDIERWRVAGGMSVSRCV